jgi:single-strand DNA-binding protein
MLNKCMVIGRLGADPEMRYTGSGDAVTNFSVAASRQYTTTSGERREETEWFRVVTWRRLAETCAQYLSKGRLVYVEGRIQTRSYDGQDGQKRYITELIAQDVRFLGGREDGGSSGGGAYAAGVPVGADGEGDIDADDLPF